MKPVILLGEGARDADLEKVMNLECPVLTTWQAKDMVDNGHRNYFGSPGLYGNRIANKILYEADEVFVIGARLSVWTVGYGQWTKASQIHVVDIDREELGKHLDVIRFNCSAAFYIDKMKPFYCKSWLSECWQWANELPWIESPTHDDPTGYIHSHQFVDVLQRFFSKDEIIVTDMGSAMVSAFQTLRLKPPQRLMTSGGLGEMGVALSAAIGASFGSGKKRVICLHCDGGMMMNLQELQTIIHHNLPIKIIVFENKGYTMIKGTQDNMNMKRTSVSPDSGVSFPDYRRLAQCFGFASCDVTTWDEFNKAIPQMFATDYPSLIVYHMDPEQKLLPKIQPVVLADGTIMPPRFDKLSPQL